MRQIESYSNIFDYIRAQETAYKLPIELQGGWRWSMKTHLDTSFLYTNSQLITGKDDYKPVKNITLANLNLQHRAEDVEMKEVQLYVDDPDKFHLSFLVKKYHDDVFVQENDIDTFFDELNVERIDYGGGLSKETAKGREVVPLQSISFCDQTDILSGSIGLKHFYSPDQLLDMADKGWGNKEKGATATLEDVITLSRAEKNDNSNSGVLTKTPGRYIEVYEVHGNMPKLFSDNTDTSGKYETRIFIVCFYQKPNSTEEAGIILYTAPETESPFMLIKRDPIFGRGLGRGGAEELFDPQVWVNYDMIREQNMLDAAAVTLMKSTDPTVVAKHPSGLKGMKNMEVIDIALNTDISQIDTFPRNMRLFENSVNKWEEHARNLSAAQDPLQGKEPAAGTPFASLQVQIQQGMGLHEYRRGQFAKHIEQIYKKTFIPKIQKAIINGVRFLSELTMEEMQFVVEKMAVVEWNKYCVNKVLEKGEFVDGEREVWMQQFKDDFRKKGNKHFIELLKGEFKDTPLSVKVSVAGKSKNLSVMADKITNIFRFAFANPQGFAQVMQIPGMATSFNEMLEFSGMSPADFSGIEKLAIAQPAPQPSPLQPNPAMA